MCVCLLGNKIKIKSENYSLCSIICNILFIAATSARQRGVDKREWNVLPPALKSPPKFLTKAFNHKPYINISCGWNSLVVAGDCHADDLLPLHFFVFIFMSANGTERAAIFFGRPLYVTPHRESRGTWTRRSVHEKSDKTLFHR